MAGAAARYEDGVAYRDLNGNGRMDPYEDPRLSAEERVADLLPRLSLEEKAGLLFQPILGVGEPGAHDAPGRGVAPRTLVATQLINHVNLHELPAIPEYVRWHNALQELAEASPHGIPITFSSDPRHAFTENSGVSFAAGAMSQWPEPLGLAALRSADRVREFAEVQRQEYLAVGIRCALHPQIDLATEPRWGRQAQTFGQDGALAAELVVAYLGGMQGAQLGPAGVACTTKHFPGGGPQQDGEDPHFPYGREQVYPGGRFAEHLEPFRAAIGAGTAAIMPYYGMPIGLVLDGEPVEEVGFSFSRRIITGLLREELGYDGVLVTDWGLITDRVVMGKPFPARAWGLEHLSERERMQRLLDAGVDQFGGETRTDLLLDLVRSGAVEESRLDDPVRRLLLVKFRLGLFDDPYLDEGAAVATVGREDFREAGHRAQAESGTVLRNAALPTGAPALPLRPGLRVFLEGVTTDAGAAAGLVAVDEPADADVALVRLTAPFEPRNEYFLEARFHQGSLDFPAEVVERIRGLAELVPVVLEVTLDRPAILTPFETTATALVATYGASDAALLDALTGRIPPRGRLPFELPRSTAAVEASASDVPGTEDPLFPLGSGVDLQR